MSGAPVWHEPAVESLNALDLDVSSVGNHEFDEGVTELERMQRGGDCHLEDGCVPPGARMTVGAATYRRRRPCRSRDGRAAQTLETEVLELLQAAQAELIER